MPPTTPALFGRFVPVLLLLTLGRLAINTNLRMMFPFAPAIARGLELPVQAITDLIALRYLVGLIGPLFGALSERYGRRKIAVASLWLFSVSMWLVPLWPTYAGLAVGLGVAMLAKSIYDPTVYGYLGDAVPYHRRGRVVGFLEISWAGGMFIGAPLVGLVMAWQGWQAPFWGLGAVSAVAALWLGRIMPPVARGTAAPPSLTIFQVLRQRPVIWAVLLYILFFATSMTLMFVNYGSWLEQTFASQLGQLGQTLFRGQAGLLGGLGVVTAVIGAAELLGEGSTALFSDKWGKRPFVLVCAAVVTIMYALLPSVSHSLLGVMSILFILFIAFEGAVVGGLSLYSELVPEARSVVLSVIFGGINVGFALGSWLGTRVWEVAGLARTCYISAVLALIALVLFYRYIEEGSMKDEG